MILIIRLNLWSVFAFLLLRIGSSLLHKEDIHELGVVFLFSESKFVCCLDATQSIQGQTCCSSAMVVAMVFSTLVCILLYKYAKSVASGTLSYTTLGTSCLVWTHMIDFVLRHKLKEQITQKGIINAHSHHYKHF